MFSSSIHTHLSHIDGDTKTFIVVSSMFQDRVRIWSVLYWMQYIGSLEVVASILCHNLFIVSNCSNSMGAQRVDARKNAVKRGFCLLSVRLYSYHNHSSIKWINRCQKFIMKETAVSDAFDFWTLPFQQLHVL